MLQIAAQSDSDDGQASARSSSQTEQFLLGQRHQQRHWRLPKREASRRRQRRRPQQVHKCKQQTVCPAPTAAAAPTRGRGLPLPLGRGLIPILGIPRRAYLPQALLLSTASFHSHLLSTAPCIGLWGIRSTKSANVCLCLCACVCVLVCVSVCDRGNVQLSVFSLHFCCFLVNLQLSCQRKWKCEMGNVNAKRALSFPNLQFVSEI